MESSSADGVDDMVKTHQIFSVPKSNIGDAVVMFDINFYNKPFCFYTSVLHHRLFVVIFLFDEVEFYSR